MPAYHMVRALDGFDNNAITWTIETSKKQR